jgi:CCR4-NOT transcription complex subunit 3
MCGSVDKLTVHAHMRSQRARQCQKNPVNNIQSTLTRTRARQVEMNESEQEQLLATARKKDPPARVKALTEQNSRHKKHVERLEQILRALNNETLQFEQVDAIKDDFQDYLVCRLPNNSDINLNPIPV